VQSWCEHWPAQGRRCGSVWEIVLEEGEWCAPAPFPAELGRWRGPERVCYANAARLATRVPALRYVEGIADPGVAPGLVFEHVWCIDSDGTVLDPTWTDQVGAAYLGVPLSLEYRRRILTARPARGDTSACWTATSPLNS
jgi:hypothetical protein